MYDKFEQLTKEKQNRILNAAFLEFATKGYKLASTDTIAKEAEISKGALFLYFKNKKGMFVYLFDYAVQKTTKEFFERVDFDEPDMLNRYKGAILVKLSVMKDNPSIYEFITRVTIEDVEELKPIIDERVKEIAQSGYARLFSDIDYSLFKEGIDKQKAINIILWTLEGYSNSLLNKYRKTKMLLSDFDHDQILKEIDEYLYVLKTCLYKKEAE